MTKLRSLEDLPADERKYIEQHIKDIPLDWDPTRLRKLSVPTRYKWYERYEQLKNQTYDKPIAIEYVEFEYKRVSVGEQPFNHVGLALIANNDIFVWWLE